MNTQSRAELGQDDVHFIDNAYTEKSLVIAFHTHTRDWGTS